MVRGLGKIDSAVITINKYPALFIKLDVDGVHVQG